VAGAVRRPVLIFFWLLLTTCCGVSGSTYKDLDKAAANRRFKIRSNTGGGSGPSSSSLHSTLFATLIEWRNECDLLNSWRLSIFSVKPDGLLSLQKSSVARAQA
jgi:hypothetical protein